MLENVKGLLTHNKGATLETICAAFREIGYKVRYELLNAADFGVAQKRERLIIVAARRMPKDHDECPIYFPPKQVKKVATLRDALKGCPESQGAQYSERDAKILEQVPPGCHWRSLPEEVAREYMGPTVWANRSRGGQTGMARRLGWDEPCLTILTQPQGKQSQRCHPDETRPLTVRESARVQSFPDDWEFCGSMASQYKQIGNAVPFNLAFYVAVAARRMLDARGWVAT